MSMNYVYYLWSFRFVWTPGAVTAPLPMVRKMVVIHPGHADYVQH